MDINALAALLAAGTVTTFYSHFGKDTTGTRGAVVQIGSPLNQDLVIVCDMNGYLHEWDRRTVRVG